MKKLLCLLLIAVSAWCSGQTVSKPKGQALTPRQENIMRALINVDVEAWRHGQREDLTFLDDGSRFKSEADINAAAERLARFSSDLARNGLSQEMLTNEETRDVGNFPWLLFGTVFGSYFSADSYCRVYDDECREKAIQDRIFDDEVGDGRVDERKREAEALQMLKNIGFPEDAFRWSN